MDNMVEVKIHCSKCGWQFNFYKDAITNQEEYMKVKCRNCRFEYGILVPPNQGEGYEPKRLLER